MKSYGQSKARAQNIILSHRIFLVQEKLLALPPRRVTQSSSSIGCESGQLVGGLNVSCSFMVMNNLCCSHVIYLVDGVYK